MSTTYSDVVRDIVDSASPEELILLGTALTDLGRQFERFNEGKARLNESVNRPVDIFEKIRPLNYKQPSDFED